MPSGVELRAPEDVSDEKAASWGGIPKEEDVFGDEDCRGGVSSDRF